MNSLLKKNTPIVVCGEINFPNTNWDTNQSTDTEENNMLNKLDRLNAEQVIRFPACGRKTLDVVFAENLVVNAPIDEKFESCYNCSDHRPVSFDFYISRRKRKPLHDCYYSYGSANYDGIRTYMNQNPFGPECFINGMNKEFETYATVLSLCSCPEERDIVRVYLFGIRVTHQTCSSMSRHKGNFIKIRPHIENKNCLKWKNC